MGVFPGNRRRPKDSSVAAFMRCVRSRKDARGLILWPARRGVVHGIWVGNAGHTSSGTVFFLETEWFVGWGAVAVVCGRGGDGELVRGRLVRGRIGSGNPDGTGSANRE